MDADGTFNDTDQALRFAFALAEIPICKTSSINAMRGGQGNGELTPHDRHAQAAMLRRMVDGLPFMERNLLVALYTWNIAHRKQAINNILPLVSMTLPTGLKSNRALYRFVEGYVSRKYSAASIGRDENINERTAQHYAGIIRKQLDATFQRADALMGEAMGNLLNAA